ncbi:MAG TPA: hypothetical protein VHK69_06750 [Chitinophagaceae bacterium]|jgi:DNA-directed RNA polymerase specialized sigma24 family protein|nr:hypothetical protein [Chitinophagaceae bacterium]
MLACRNEMDVICALKRHDVAAFSATYDRFAPLFFRILVKELYDRKACEAVLNATFCALWKATPTLNPSGDRLLPWALRILRAELRKKKVELTLQALFACQVLRPSVHAQKEAAY